MTIYSLREWTRERLAVYKIPTQIKVVEELPCNGLGKVSKPEVMKLFKVKKGTKGI